MMTLSDAITLFTSIDPELAEDSIAELLYNIQRNTKIEIMELSDPCRHL